MHVTRRAADRGSLVNGAKLFLRLQEPFAISADRECLQVNGEVRAAAV